MTHQPLRITTPTLDLTLTIDNDHLQIDTTTARITLDAPLARLIAQALTNSANTLDDTRTT